MKKIFLMSIVVLLGQTLTAQFRTGTLQAAGLTCAMCTKAINTSLKELFFVESVKADIKNSQFIIRFKENAKVDPDDLKRAVEDAGFSVAKLSLVMLFNKVEVNNDSHIKLNGKTYHFLDIDQQLLNGEKTIIFIDKNFVVAKEFKKYAAKTQMDCVKTGKAGSCCAKEGVKENERIYHVTI